jgi:adenylate kinase family enzyme
MERIVVFGNAGAGKSTFAKALSRLYQAAHLDLDTVAWTAEPPGVRADVQASTCALMQFIESAGNWVIEGCYADLLRAAAPHCTEMIFLNPGIEACVENCRARPWEPHKYENREAQDANLPMLIPWVRRYETREDECSLSAHRELFDMHQGRKVECRTNAAAARRTSATKAREGVLSCPSEVIMSRSQ